MKLNKKINIGIVILILISAAATICGIEILKIASLYSALGKIGIALKFGGYMGLICSMIIAFFSLHSKHEKEDSTRIFTIYKATRWGTTGYAVELPNAEVKIQSELCSTLSDVATAIKETSDYKEGMFISIVTTPKFGAIVRRGDAGILSLPLTPAEITELHSYFAKVSVN